MKKASIKLDVRSTYILWLNNVENDQRYMMMGKNILYYNFGDGIYPIRLNIFNIVLYLDPSSPHFYNILNLVSRLIQNNYPLHFGIVIITDFTNQESLSFSRAFVSLLRRSKVVSAMNYAQKVFENENAINLEKVVSFYKTIDTRDSYLITQNFHESDNFLKQSKEYFTNLGLVSTPTAVFNGEILSQELVQGDLIQALMIKYQKIVNELRKDLSEGTLRILKKTEDSFMAGREFYTRIKTEFFSQISNIPVLSSIKTNDCSDLKLLDRSGLYYCLLKSRIFYIPDPQPKFTIWLLVNPEKSTGIELINQVLSIEKNLHIRYGLIITSEPGTGVTVTDLMIDSLFNNRIEKDHLKQLIESPDLSRDDINLTQTRKILDDHKVYKNLFNVFNDGSYIIALHQKFPVTESDTFVASDFELISRIHLQRFQEFYARKINTLVKRRLGGVNNDLDETCFNDIITNILSYKFEKEIYELPDTTQFPEFLIDVPPRPGESYVKMHLFVNPLSDEVQKWAGLVKVIRKVINVDLRIFLIMDQMFGKSTSNRFYRYVLESDVRFKDSQVDPMMNTAVFDPLPQNALYTFHSETTQGWFIKSDFSNCDMDNINLEQSHMGCIGLYELEYLMVEGHAYDSRKGQPASGLQLVLGSKSNENMFDTIVIHNLGYFQFKVSPGDFHLSLKAGEYFDSYQIESIKSLTTGVLNAIPIDSFLGQLIKVKVLPKSKEKPEEDKPSSGWWKSLTE
ncbi:UDP-glucose:glycoprotein glucosyltransferase [Thelohanellus kitauei]|uniref:UDP-glucose:glycoprotein glucosyltransferase n=1 Tax=Thelohanellus kitauei TaxID=669202 RepID=A0A0C2MLR5_THEKT|nr:UDP-glucose:glycoprotein glucosyltransferase [Thelohanellus kitauei]